ncbi:hypothetical protein ACN4BX_09245 [Corynebacterium macclintockiae]|uniref:hypothetical protein n=1 Tax=Corynebacterium macclintockiae TaxID=2913501 RepID=UPI003EB76890
MSETVRVTKVVIHNEGFDQMRSDPALVRDLNRRAHAIAKAAGEGYEVSSRTGKKRHRVSVITESYEAAEDTAKNNTLLRALDAGR